MQTKVLLGMIFIAACLFFSNLVGLSSGVVDIAHAEKKKDTVIPPGPAPSAQCKKQCAVQETACKGRCRGLEPQVTICQERCSKALDECVQKCDQIPTSLLDYQEKHDQIRLSSE